MDKTLPPSTPEWLAPLSRELEEVIAKRNLLTCRTGREILTDLETVAAEGEDEEMEKLRIKAVNELINSEKSYLRRLEITQDFFARPIQEREILPHTVMVAIFGDLTSIIQVNRELLAALESSTDKIGQVFLEVAPYLKFYSTYANDFNAAAKLVEHWMDKSKPFRTFLGNQESRPEVKMKLNALLITPVQRIPRYKLLLEDVIKNTPDMHPDKANLKDALTQIDAVAWYINDQLREHENNQKMVDIQQSLVGGIPKIVAPGRRLIKQGNLMKVPRAGGSGHPRYFVLFSDILMYCKIRASGVGTLVLPKSNSLDCGCLLPIKHLKVETIVGKGVFKVTCQKEELILYSSEGAVDSHEWVEEIQRAVKQLRNDAKTLRKESSRREPLKRPDMLKMRRESLGQIMMRRKTDEAKVPWIKQHKMVLRERNKGDSSNGASPVLSPRKKRRAAETPKAEETTPSKRSKDESPKTTPVFAAPGTPPSTMRSKRRSRPSWKTLSLTRKELLRQEAKPVFRSPSIYDKEDDGIMTSYLSGKICPLTPSQRPTNISHLADRSDAKEDEQPEEQQQVEKQEQNFPVVAAHAPSKGFCVVM